MLQSRAPSWSETDLNFVREEFRLGRILPRLEEPALRNQVELAICSQGPILTLETFAQDVRLLQSRVRRSLNNLVLGVRRKKRDTLRTRICDILCKEVDRMSLELSLPNPSDAERQALVRRCYQHVFLYAIRTKNSVERKHLSAVVKQELDPLRTHERELSLQSQLTEEGAIATQAPADDLPDIEVDINRRHGHLLLKDLTATKHLYCDRINDGCVSSLPLTRSSMAKHIVRIFLLGRAAFEQTQTLSSGLPAAIAQSASTVAHSTPFDISPISTCASDELVHSLNSPTCTATPTTLNIRDVRRGRAKASKTAVESMAVELVHVELSPASSAHTSNRVTTKRSASVSTLDTLQDGSIDKSRPIKRLRRKGWFGQEEQNVVLSETGDPHYRRRSATGTVSPSIYSVDRRSSISQPDNGRFSSSIGPETRFCARDYADLVRECDPYAGQSNHGVSNSQTIVSSPCYTGKLTIARHPPSRPTLGASANETTQELQTVGSRNEAPRFILYKSLRHESMVHCALRTRDSTKRFVASQKKLDPKSRLLYIQNENGKDARNAGDFNGKDARNARDLKHASNAEQLYHAIERFGLATVFVDSGRLGYKV